MLRMTKALQTSVIEKGEKLFISDCLKWSKINKGRPIILLRKHSAGFKWAPNSTSLTVLTMPTKTPTDKTDML